MEQLQRYAALAPWEAAMVRVMEETSEGVWKGFLALRYACLEGEQGKDPRYTGAPESGSR